MHDERERRLRRVFGPPVPADRPPDGPAEPPRRRPRPGPALAAAVAVAVVGAAGVAFWALTPHDHVAPGCSWWTARQVGDATPGTHGCLRGYVRFGGAIAEGPGSDALALSYSTTNPDTTTHRSCPFRPGDAVVVRYHSVFDDGRTLIVVDDCR
ncbi:MAG TPA: hypothetical protein VFD01_13755 [Candidatus Dormibacteraeota bacterium]|nr:hypothetical protein [Candidatus Dormibacteraeota bacterium]